MSKALLNPHSPSDEIPGLVSGSLAQVTESIDNAQSHYDVFRDLGLNPENAGDPLMQRKLRLMHKTLRPEFHPDKVFNKLQGDETEAQIEALRQLMQERFQKLQEAYEVLSDEDKRETYDRMQEKRVIFSYEMPQPGEKEKEEQDPSWQGVLVEALVPLEEIEAFYREYFKELFGDDANFETMGFSVRYSPDRQRLELSFPDRECAEMFMARLAEREMINLPQGYQGKDEDSGYQLPQLKPRYIPESAE